MLQPRWYKVIRDLWSNKLRTILVILAIAVGIFAYGLVGSARDVLATSLFNIYMETNPASIIYILSPFDADLVQAVEGLPEVADAEGRVELATTVEVRPGTWLNLTLYGIDYDDMTIHLVGPDPGDIAEPPSLGFIASTEAVPPIDPRWPPRRREILFERTLAMTPGVALGDLVTVEVLDGTERHLNYAGLAYDVAQFPTVYFQEVYGYVNLDTMHYLTDSRQYNLLYVVVSGDRFDKDTIEDTAVGISDRIEHWGYTVYNASVPNPGEHWNKGGQDAVLYILGTLGFFSLVLSAFLVVNTISAVLSQQVRQVGIMKAIGGRGSQIAGIYVVSVLILGILSLSIAIPLGQIGARGLANFTAVLGNFKIERFWINPTIIIGQVILAVVVPLLAAAYPVWSGVRVPPYKAISDYGIGSAQRGAWIDRMVDRVRGLPRPLLLSLRNTFRRKGRLILTLLTLTLAGAVFISIFSIHTALLNMFDELLGLINYDVSMGFSTPYRLELVEREVLEVPGITNAEGWITGDIQYVRPDDTDGPTSVLVAVPPQTAFVDPPIRQGRWLEPGDQYKVVVNMNFLQLEKEVELGDSITLRLAGYEKSFEIVGVTSPLSDPEGSAGFIYIPLETYWDTTGQYGYVNMLAMDTSSDDLTEQIAIVRQAEEDFQRRGIGVSSTAASGTLLAGSLIAIDTLVALMLMMAVLLGLVGGMGLTGTLSLNVIERTREIGVMRALGASNTVIWQIVVAEGLLIGLISTVLGAVLAVPISKALTYGIGLAFLRDPLRFAYSSSGLLLWIGASLLLATLASFLPARAAVQISVRQALAYE